MTALFFDNLKFTSILELVTNKNYAYVLIFTS
jgi:hypothetical protein